MALAWMPALCVNAQNPVIGLLNGTEIWTASATRFSTSRSMGRLYLLLV